MRIPRLGAAYFLFLGLAGFWAMQAAFAAEPASTAGAVRQTAAPSISQKPSILPLDLSQAQHARVRQVLRSQDTEVSLALKCAKPAQNFNASVGATVPGNLRLHPLPAPLIYEMPRLKQYTYSNSSTPC
jgi:hypothetical protein